MPFAPVTCMENAKKCYEIDDGALHTARFMTITVKCTDAMKEKCPGVVHVDGTARPQLIDEETDPGYYRIVKHFEELTGLPSIVNTSFNMHGEPIVMTPADGIRSFVASGLDAMQMGPFIVGQLDQK